MSLPTKATRLTNYRYKISHGPHSITSDVIREKGGEDTAMSPHELLEGALATCTAMTMQMYANRKAWPLEGADVEVKILEEGKTNLIDRVIHLHGPLSDEQKQRLLEIADKCPVHKLLVGHTAVQTREAP